MNRQAPGDVPDRRTIRCRFAHPPGFTVVVRYLRRASADPSFHFDD